MFVNVLLHMKITRSRCSKHVHSSSQQDRGDIPPCLITRPGQQRASPHYNYETYSIQEVAISSAIRQHISRLRLQVEDHVQTLARWACTPSPLTSNSIKDQLFIAFTSSEPTAPSCSPPTSKRSPTPPEKEPSKKKQLAQN